LYCTILLVDFSWFWLSRLGHLGFMRANIIYFFKYFDFQRTCWRLF